MLSLRCLFRFSRLSEIRNPSFYVGSCKKCISTSTVKLEKNEVPSALSKYEKFTEGTAPVILDVEEERQKVIEEEEEEEFEQFKGFNLKRGVTGVFEVEELVEILKCEKAEDIVVLKIPPEYSYVDYMVIVNGRSTRHMFAMSDFVRRLYKQKRDEKDLIPKFEGSESNTWMAIDLGNIALHVFSKTGRELYDIETLWTVGREFDSQYKFKPSENLSLDFAKILASLNPK